MSGFVNTWIAGVNEIGRAFWGYTAGMFVQSAVLIVVLLLIDLALRKRLRATLRYWIWMLVLIKLLLPPTLSLPTGIGYWVGVPVTRPAPMAPPPPQTSVVPAISGISMSEEVVARTGMPMSQTASAEVLPLPMEPMGGAAAWGGHLTWQGGVFLLWSVGVLVLGIRVIQRLHFVRRLLAEAKAAEGPWLDLLEQCRRRAGVRQRIAMKVSTHSFSPAVCGLWRPTILLPASLLAELSPDDVRAVLIHELAHVKRADLWVNCLQTALQIVYFYNPLVWLANALVRRVREQAVDEMVLVALGAEAGSYGRTLIDIAERAFLRASPALRLVGVAESRKSLEGRIRHMVARPIPKSTKVGLAGCLVVLGTAAVLLPMARAQNSPSAGAADVSNGESATPVDSRDPANQNETEAQELLKIGDAYCQQKKYAEACGIYRHLLDRYPGANCARTARGSLVLAAAMLGDEPSLRAALDSLLTSLPTDQRLCQQVLQVAEHLRLRFQYGPARQLFQHVVDTWPQTQEADSARMGLVDVKVGPVVPTQDKAALQETIEKLVAQYQGNPYLPRTIERIGGLCEHGKRYDEAETIFRRVIVLAEQDAERAADAQTAIAWLYFARARYDEALHEYTKVVQDYPKTKAAAGGQYWMGQCYLSMGDLDQAERAYKTTMDLYPGDIYAGHAQRQLALVDRRREIAAANAQRREALQRTTNLRSAQVGQAQPPLAVRPASEAPSPVRPAPGFNLNTTEYDSRVAEIMQRFAAAVEQAYQVVGLTKQRVEGLLSVQRQAPDESEEMKAYQRSWPAILQARQVAIDEMASLGPGAVPALLRARDNSGERRVGNMFSPAIAAMGAPAVPAVLEGLSKGDQPVRVRAIAALRELRDPRGVEPLLTALGDSDRIVRISAIQALDALADPRAADALLALWSQGDDETRVHLAAALGRLRDKRAIEPMATALREWMAASRRTGIWPANSWSIYVNALRQIGDPQVIPVLEEVLQAGPQKTKSGSAVYMIADAAAQALRGLGCEVIGDREKGGYAVVRRSVAIASGAPEPPDRPALPQNRDYETAKTVPQPIERWRTQDYGCPGNPRTWQAFQRDGKRAYPVTLVWPLIQGAGKYVVHIKGLRGSWPARSYEATTNSLRLERADLAPGRYQWSVSVYDAQGTFLGDVETIDPADVFAVADPQPAQANGKRVLIDLNHSTGNIAGWGWNNHGQYMTKELLESVGFAVDINARDLLTTERLRSVDLLICHYYWTGWPDFRPYLESELAAVRQFVERGGSLLVVGCDGADGRGKMTRAGNQLVQEFGLRFQWDGAIPEDGWAQVLPQQNILSVDRRVQVQLPVEVEGEGSVPLVQFQGVPIARAKSFGKGKIIVAGVGMSFLDCYLGDFEYREPVHIIMFYDFVKYLTGVDWKQTCEKELLQTIQSRARVVGAPR